MRWLNSSNTRTVLLFSLHGFSILRVNNERRYLSERKFAWKIPRLFLTHLHNGSTVSIDFHLDIYLFRIYCYLWHTSTIYSDMKTFIDFSSDYDTYLLVQRIQIWRARNIESISGYSCFRLAQQTFCSNQSFCLCKHGWDSLHHIWLVLKVLILNSSGRVPWNLELLSSGVNSFFAVILIDNKLWISYKFLCSDGLGPYKLTLR